MKKEKILSVVMAASLLIGTAGCGGSGGGAMNIFLMRQFMRGIPKTYTEAAILDGASNFRIYWNIVLPLIKPIIIFLSVQTFFGVWNDFQRYQNEDAAAADTGGAEQLASCGRILCRCWQRIEKQYAFTGSVAADV